jgi:plasmid stabilization system protein ParE
VEARFHRRVQSDLNEIIRRYDAVSTKLGDDFFAELQLGLRKAAENPKYFHFDRSGLRRCNLERFPYHFLYDIRGEYIRVWVVRHNRRSPEFGMRRFSQ